MKPAQESVIRKKLIAARMRLNGSGISAGKVKSHSCLEGKCVAQAASFASTLSNDCKPSPQGLQAEAAEVLLRPPISLLLTRSFATKLRKRLNYIMPKNRRLARAS